MASIRVKRGDTFSYTAKWDGAKASELKSQVRTFHDAFVSDVKITATSDENVFLLTVADTSKWPVGDLVTDIERTYNNTVISSETIFIRVVKDVTKA